MKPRTLSVLPGLPLVLIVFCMFLVSCSNLRIERPDGFADFKERNLYRAVSPEGMLFGVRTVDNYPRKNLDFWAEALKNQLKKEGYRLVREGEPFSAGQHNGMLFEWGVPYANESYIYLTAVLVSGNRIAIAEAGGEHTVYQKHRDALIASLQSLNLQ